MPNIPETFHLKIFDEKVLLFAEEIKALEAVNEAGPFSVLSGHTNFVSVITGALNENKLVVHLANETTQEFIFQKGVLKIFENAAEVFLVFDLNIGVE